MVAAREALNSFLDQLNDPNDEVFLTASTITRCWSRAGRATSSASAMLCRESSRAGGTALYDAVAEAVPLALVGTQSKEGDRHHLRRQRHEQPAPTLRRSSGIIREAKCSSTRSASTARASSAGPGDLGGHRVQRPRARDSRCRFRSRCRAAAATRRRRLQAIRSRRHAAAIAAWTIASTRRAA